MRGIRVPTVTLSVGSGEEGEGPVGEGRGPLSPLSSSQPLSWLPLNPGIRECCSPW